MDDKMHDHRKVRRTPTKSIGVWVLAGSWCADNLEDGFVPEAVARRWGGPKDFAALVDAELWVEATKDGEPGWEIVNWAEYQPSREEVQAVQAMRADRAAKGAHVRWHVTEGKPDPRCALCREEGLI